ncbi:MAG: ABC-type transport auxiliary lipoprotein family protein, partial [Pseudomonadota bacterium]
MRLSRSAAFACAAGLVLSACVSVLPETPPPAPRFTLDAPTPRFDGVPVAATIAVERPSSLAALDTTAVAIVKDGYRVAYHRDLEWSDRAPRLVETMIIRTLENTDLFPNAGRRTKVGAARYRLYTDIRAFEQVDEPERAARIALRVSLLDTRSGDIVGALLIDELEPLDG